MSVSSGLVKTLVLACFTATAARPQAIDPAKSTLTVHVGKAGAFSAFGHDHEIAAPIEHGSVDTGKPAVELRVRADALRVLDRDVSEKDRAAIQSTMLGAEVLDVRRYPEIVFRCTAADTAGRGAMKLRGELTLHGQTRPVTVTASERDGHYIGSAVFKQTEFGIQPVRVAGGTVRVKDEVRIEFDVQLAR